MKLTIRINLRGINKYELLSAVREYNPGVG